MIDRLGWVTRNYLRWAARRSGLRRINQCFHRQQTYENFEIHNVDKGLQYLREQIVGFFVLAPLDWGKDQLVADDPTKATDAKVDVAVINFPDANKEGAA